jgi:hypothetical protein
MKCTFINLIIIIIQKNLTGPPPLLFVLICYKLWILDGPLFDEFSIDWAFRLMSSDYSDDYTLSSSYEEEETSGISLSSSDSDECISSSVNLILPYLS